MLQEALSRASTYVDGFLSAYNKHCCCSTDPRDDPQGKYGDVVVFTDWGTKEEGPGATYAGFADPLMVDPAAVRGARPGEAPTKEPGRRGAAPSASSAASADTSRAT